MTDRSPPWVVVITKPACEELAERNLRQYGYRVYLPRYRKLLRPHGSERRGQPSMRPLLAGYLFVHDWHGWPETPVNGVLRLMQSVGRTVEMPDCDVDLIWHRERSGKFDEVEPPRSRQRIYISLGAAVEIDLLGERINAVLEELTDSGKAIVRSMMFDRETRWTVNAAELRTAAG